MDKQGRWKLSPAYDVCHAYRPGSIWVSHQSLSVNGKRQNINRDDLLAVADNVSIKKAKHIIDEIKKVIHAWRNYADQQKVESTLREEIQKTLLPV